MLTFRELTRCSWKVRITYVASSCVSVNVTLEKWKSYSIFLKYFIPNLKSKFKWMSWSIKYSFSLTKKFFITEFDCKINKVVVFHWKKGDTKWDFNNLLNIDRRCWFFFLLSLQELVIQHITDNLGLKSNQIQNEQHQ